MKITMTMLGPVDDDTQERFIFTTRFEVEDDVDAELAGQKFARLCASASAGAAVWQGAALHGDDEP